MNDVLSPGPAVLAVAPTVLAAGPVAEAVLFYVFAGVTAAAAVAVVASRDIVRTAVALLFALAGVAGLFVLLQAEFLAAVQLVVYVGGTLILIVFGVMLTSKSPFSRFHPTAGEVVVAVALGVVLLVTLVLARPTQPPPGGAKPLDPDAAYPTADLGLALLGDFLLPFEVVSVLLLAVMIGAAYLARGRKGDAAEPAARPASPATARLMREDL